MTLKHKMHISSLLWVLLLAIVIVIYLNAGSLIESLKKQQSATLALADQTRQAAETIDSYLGGSAEYSRVETAYVALSRKVGGSPLAEKLAGIWKELTTYKKLEDRGGAIQEQIEKLTSSSVFQSNQYIKVVSQKLADEAKRAQVTKLERLVIIGANLNTTANYEIKVRFLKLKENSKLKDSLLKFLDTLVENTARDIKSLANTPFAGMAQSAQKANFKIRELIQEFITNTERTSSIKHSLKKSMNEVFADLQQRNSAVTVGVFDSLRGYILVIVLVLSGAGLAGIIIAFFLAGSVSRTLSRAVGGLSKISDMLTLAANQVAHSSQDLAQTSSEQAASLEEVSSSMEEISSVTKNNADNAHQTDQMTKHSSETIAQATFSMESLRKAMEEITSASDETAKIIQTIDGIAFQTNLLALNAAVEAARAGEAGAGFAVVADEVRSLAMRAAEAARDTSKLIEGNLEHIRQGSGLVQSTDQAFAQVADSSDKVGALVAKIASASSEQSQGIEQVNQTLASMDRVVQSNAASAQESAAASEELRSQVETMRGLVRELSGFVGGINGIERETKKAAPTSVPGAAKLLSAPNKKEPERQRIIQNQDDFADF